MSESTSTPSAAPAVQPAAAGRRRDLDVLTTAIVFLLFVLHTASIFAGYQLVVNEMQSQLTSLFAGLVVVSEFIWVMPVMMFVAGIAIWHSLQRRTAGGFLRERLLRLGVPFLTGLVLVNPPQVYYFLRDRMGWQGSFLSFYPRYWNLRFSLRSFPYFLEPAGTEQTFNVVHLWFLIFLLVYTLLLTPLFIYLRGPAGQRVVAGLAGFFSRRFAIFLWAIPIALLEALVGAIWPSGWSRWIWPFIILYGYLTAADERLTDALVRHRVAGLVWGVVGFLLFFMGMGMIMQMQADPWTDRGVPAMILRLLKGATCWFLVVGIVGVTTRIGRRRAAAAEQPQPAQKPSFWGRLATYCREAQLPVYVLHQTPIIIIGYYVVRWNVGVIVKFLLISIPSLVVTMLVYELIVRRIPVVRFLFGMKPKA